MNLRRRFIGVSLAAIGFCGLFAPGEYHRAEARPRTTLGDVSTTSANQVVIAAPAFEKKPPDPKAGVYEEYWAAFIRPCDNPFVRVFSHVGQLLYGFDDYGSNESPKELATLQQVAGPYLRKNPHIRDALAARRTARGIIARFLDASVVEKKEDLEAVREQAYRWMSQPLVILSRNPSLVGRAIGPSCHFFPIGILGSDGKQKHLETSFVLLEDLRAEQGKTPFSVARAVSNDTLDLVVCHEMAHAIMRDAYGRAGNKTLRPISANGHSPELITDATLAFTEGWAEAFEAFYGRDKRNINSLGERNNGVASVLLDRQHPVRRERWLWLNGPEAKDGRLKNSAQLMACEGVIATLFYEILENRALVSPFEKSIQIMWRDRPASFPAFVSSWLKRFSEDRRILLRIVLENTRYATIDAQLPQLYQNWYEMKRKFHRKEASAEAMRTAEEAYTRRKEEVFAKALAGADPFAALFPELWVNVSCSCKVNGSAASSMRELNLDLNTMDAALFESAKLCSKAEAAKIIERRDAGGGWRGNPLAVAEAALGERWGKLAGEGVTVKQGARLPTE